MTRMCRLVSVGCLTTTLAVAFPSAAPIGQPPATRAPADLVLRNGVVVTVDAALPDAHAIAVRGDTIVAVGTDAEVAPLVGPATKVIDLRGQLAIPGLIEGHGHFTGIGQAKMNLDLMHVSSWDEVVAMVATAAKQARPGEWVLGRGWHQEKWRSTPTPNVEGFPLHDSLSAVSPDNPVVLTHASGHATFANARAMALAGVTAATANPPGGEILKDAKGNPTGLFRETASDLVRRALSAATARRSPEERLALRRREIDLATAEVLENGITSFQDAGASFETVDLYKQYVREGRLGVRLWVMIREPNDRLAQRLADYKILNMGDKRLTVRALKLSLDGALGPRGAWLLEPYSDLPASCGLNTVPVEEARETARLALRHGFQYCVHAIGDRANRETLDIFAEAFKQVPDGRALRWRVEHAQHLDPADIPRFASLGVIASMQGIHCTSDAPFVTARLGAKRAEEGAYVWQKLMRSGAIVTNGTDAPVEDVDPIASFYASVTRRLKDGTVFYGDQRMSRLEALKSYTISAAYSAFEDDIKGSITVGKLADITVLSQNILTVDERDIPSTRVVYTIVGGKVAYRAPANAVTPALGRP